MWSFCCLRFFSLRKRMFGRDSRNVLNFGTAVVCIIVLWRDSEERFWDFTACHFKLLSAWMSFQISENRSRHYCFWVSFTNIKSLVSTYVVCERLSVMHRQTRPPEIFDKFSRTPLFWNLVPTPAQIEI